MISTVVVLVAALGGQAATGGSRASLEGISCFSMGVVRATPAARDAGVSEQVLAAQVEKALAKAGASLFDMNRPEVCLGQKDDTVAFVNLNVMAAVAPGGEQAALMWRLEVMQEASLVTGRKFELVTWSASGLFMGRPVELPKRLWEELGPHLERLGLEYQQAREQFLVGRGRAGSGAAPAATPPPAR